MNRKKGQKIIAKEISMESVFSYSLVVVGSLCHCCFWWTTHNFSALFFTVFFSFCCHLLVKNLFMFIAIFPLSLRFLSHGKKKKKKQKKMWGKTLSKGMNDTQQYQQKLIQSFFYFLVFVFFIGNQQWKIDYWMGFTCEVLLYLLCGK